MKNLMVLVLLGALAWYGYGHYKARTTGAPIAAAASAPASRADAPAAPTQFKCDGRTHCSHMRSCAEATYFIRHCPGTKMDGDNDGVPCETQWCS